MESNAKAAKPVLLFCSTPADGHVIPVRTVAKNMIKRGYEVVFLTGTHYQASIESIGATFRPLLGNADFNQATVKDLSPNADRDEPLPTGLHRLARDLRWYFVSTIPAQHKSLQTVLQELDPQRKVIVVQDFTFFGSCPLMLGAPGIKPTGIISLGISPLCLEGPDIPPWGEALPYDPSPAGLARNQKLYAQRGEIFGELNVFIASTFTELGAENPKVSLFDMQAILSDRFLQMCIPELEYPRTNPPPGLRFTGGLGRGSRDVVKAKPVWWDDVVVNDDKKRIVAVSQGTTTTMFHKLVVPTLEALADCKDILVVAALGREGASLPNEVVVPANARVADFIPFDELFPYADIFVTNGGYGGFQHAISHGVPLIVAGVLSDKPEVAARVEWAGVGLNMKTDAPNPGDIRAAVEKVLADERYGRRAEELMEEIQKYDPFAIVEETIRELVQESDGAKE